mmetsp:Transcript_116744/g.206662  ORF Transcript_116744/g.206662 Transcript_116744/m.206662 type:complete len:85 (+) Transcript_116744:115-369(+)
MLRTRRQALANRLHDVSNHGPELNRSHVSACFDALGVDCLPLADVRTGGGVPFPGRLPGKAPNLDRISLKILQTHIFDAVSHLE